MLKPAIAVRAYGQSIWLDALRRGMLISGELERLVGEEGVLGVTANPTIFQQALSEGTDYDRQLAELACEGLDAGEIFDRLAASDLQQAADTLRASYDGTDGNDGFVSWEVSPEIAQDSEATLADARRLWSLLDRPNGMIKIPGTRAGIPAIRSALAEGINVNITLLFSVARYEMVMEAYLSALEQRLAAGKPISKVRSVASFFVSRVDTLVDRLLTERMEHARAAERGQLAMLRSRTGIANARVAYRRFQRTFAGQRWQALQQHGALVQRPLWASTGTKDPQLPDTYYVDGLIGPHTVNTVPLATLQAFNDHGTVDATLERGMSEAQVTLDQLAEVGLDLTAVTEQMEAEGVQTFADAFKKLRRGIDEKRSRPSAVGSAPTPVVP